MPRRTASVLFHRPVVWVTGASRGIGREIAKQFATIGCRVCLSSRTTKDLASLVTEIRSRGGHAEAFPCDLRRPETIERAAARITRRVGKVDVLVNNGGITVFKSFLDTTPSEFEEIIRTNLLGHIYATKAVLPAMVKHRRGWIFNILSTASKKTFEESSAYTAAKAGLHGLSKVLREEVRRRNVKIIDVMPGPTDTPMWSSASRKRYGSRMMSAKSVAETILAMYTLPPDVVPEEVLLSPILGDIG